MAKIPVQAAGDDPGCGRTAPKLRQKLGAICVVPILFVSDRAKIMSVLNAPAVCADRQRVFPLHLSPIEVFMLADDRSDYPMTFVIQLRLTGQVDRVAFEAALVETLQRHPLLRAFIQTGKGGLPCWMLAEEAAPAVDWAEEGTPTVCPRGERIDLASETGLRVWVRQGPLAARVVLQFHHACCDGTGAYRFIGDLLAGYGMRTALGDQSPSLGTMQTGLLRNRKQRMLGVAGESAWGLRRRAIRAAWRILSRRPRPLAAPRAAGGNGDTLSEFPGFLCASLDRAAQQRLRDVAGQFGATLNDLLLRDLFLTLEAWNRRQACGRRRLRIMMPTDLRGGEDFEMPAANLTSYTFLTRRARQCASPDKLLEGIRNETSLIKHRRAGTEFADMVLTASRVRWLLPFCLSRDVCLATAVLSNAGDPSRRFTAQFPRQAGRAVCGNLVLEEITGVPPLRRKTRATFSVSQYGRCLSISLRCDPHLFNQTDTAALLDSYIQRLRTSAGLAPKHAC